MSSATHEVIEALGDFRVRRATKFLSPHYVIKATRQHRPDMRSKLQTAVLTWGRPNFAERKFIKAAIQAREPFPIKKVQLKLYAS